MKNKTILESVIFTMTLMFLTPVLHAEGIDLGNAGLSKKQPDGQLELVEHLANAVCPSVDDNKALFKEVAPELTARLSQISKADPLLALALWRDVNDMHIRICPFPLEKIKGCPKPEFEGEVVVGCRLSDGAQGFGNKVYFAEKDILKSHERPEYVFLHESLHKIIPGNDQAHQQNVNEFSNYLFENQEKLQRDTLRRILINEMNAKSYLDIPGIYNSRTSDTSMQSYESFVGLIMDGNASATAQCTLMQLTSETAISQNPVAKLMQSFISDAYRWPLLPNNCKGTPPLRERVFKTLGKNFRSYVSYLGNNYSTYVSNTSYNPDLFDCNYSLKRKDISEIRSWAWAWSGIQKTRELVFSSDPALTEENRALAKIYLDFFPDSARGLPRLEDYAQYTFSGIFSDWRVSREYKQGLDNLQDILEAEKRCKEKFFWDSQKEEWVKDASSLSSAKQANGSTGSSPSPVGTRIWSFFHKKKS